MNQSNIFYLFFISVLFFSCAAPVKQWEEKSIIQLEGINPLGMAKTENGFWISDSDNNNLINMDNDGKIISTIPDFERPMHISIFNNEVYVPEYGTDTIVKINNGEKIKLELNDSLDAPAGVDVLGDKMGIADFYNHRILFKNGDEYSSIGKEGHGDGELYYPTDVQIFNDWVYVADAYNNRVQVFDFEGNVKQVIGADQGMNAATGLFVSEEYLFVTDFENDRVLVFDNTGNLLQEITENMNKPTDVILANGKLYIANYKGKNIIVLE